MFNLGFTEMLLLSIIALIVIGPKQLPEMARVLGRLMNEFKRATSDFTSSVHDFKSKTDNYMADTERTLMASDHGKDKSGEEVSSQGSYEDGASEESDNGISDPTENRPEDPKS